MEGDNTFIADILAAGISALTEYLSAHVITCLVPAMFIAGAIAVFLHKENVLKYLGPKTKKHISYAIAAVSGTVLAVCSCTILPIFAGIKKRGAGLGPATTLLFAGPAINILAIIYTAQILGIQIGLARAILAISLSVVIGLVMHAIFQKKAVEDGATLSTVASGHKKSKSVILSFFALLIGILVINGLQIDFAVKSVVSVIMIAFLILMLKLRFAKPEITEWGRETWFITKLIIPYLLIGVFIAGIIGYILPSEIVQAYLGGNSLLSNFVASVFGAFMYFATLTEVPIVSALMKLGMGNGPALALLLAGPSLSLPSMLVIRKVLGTKQTAVYVCLVIFFSAIAGFVFGNILW